MRKKVFFSIGILMLCLVGYGVYLYKKPHADASALAADYTLNATALYADYEKDEAAADKKYLSKIIAVKGTISGVEKTDSTLTYSLQSDSPMGGINCSMASTNKQAATAKKGDAIIIKGRCTGFLADVALVDCVIEK